MIRGRVSLFIFSMGLALGALGPLQAKSKTSRGEPLAVAPEELSLPQAMEIALTRNPDIILAELNQKIFESQYWQTVGLALPEINLTGTYSRNYRRPSILFGDSAIQMGRDQGLMLDATVQQPLYTGGKVGSAVKAARSQREAGEAETQGARETVLLGVKQLFFGTLLAQELERIQDDNLKSTEDHLRTIRERYRQGLDSDLIVRRQEVEVANAKAMLLIARNFKDNRLTDLQDILALDVDKPLRLIGELQSPQDELPAYDTYVQKALSQRPELVAARKRTLVAADLIKIARGDLLPTLGLYGTYQWNAQYDNWPAESYEKYNSLAGGVQIQQQLFSGGRNWQQIKEATYKYDQAREEESRLERSVRVDVKKRWLSVVEALERARAEEAALDAARLALKATETRYREGQASQLELNDARVARNRTRTIYSQALSDYWISLAGLERAAGIYPQEVKK